jgi:hypothetical protein
MLLVDTPGGLATLELDTDEELQLVVIPHPERDATTSTWSSIFLTKASKNWSCCVLANEVTQECNNFLMSAVESIDAARDD